MFRTEHEWTRQPEFVLQEQHQRHLYAKHYTRLPDEGVWSGFLMRHQHSVADDPLELPSGSLNVIDLLDLLPCAAAIWDLGKDRAMLNPQAQQLFAVVEGEGAIATDWTDLIHPQDRSIFIASRGELLSGRQRTVCDYRFFPNGQRQAIWLREVSTIHSALHGKPGSVLSVYTNISDLKKRRTREKDKWSRKTTAAMIDGLTHEVQNSLQGIGLGLDLLSMATSDPVEGQIVTQAIERASRLLRETREYFCPPEIQPSSEDLFVVLGETVQRVEQEWVQKGVSIEIRPPACPLPLSLDWRQFRKALERSLAFSCAPLSEGGEIHIEITKRLVSSHQEITLSFDCSAETPLKLDEEWPLQPFTNINRYQIGLSLVLVDELLQQYNGRLSFHRKGPKQSLLKMRFRAV